MSTTDPTTLATSPTSDPSEKLPFVERVADRMNPILVKEVRQAMKSRAFVTTFMLLIACCWLVSIVGAIAVGASLEYYSYAERFFVSYFIPLAVAIGVVVPFLAYHSMLNERFDDTFEMLSITTLNARSIVSGKLTNAIVLVMLCFSAITPFIAFTSLLQGFRLTPVIFTLIVGLFASIGLCALALLFSTLARSRIMQGLIALILLVILGYITSFCNLLFMPGFWSLPASWSTFGLLAILCLAICFLVLLVREITVAQITFQSDNHSTGVRLVTTIFIVFAIVSLIVYWYLNRPVSVYELVLAFSMVSVLLMAILVLVGYFSCTEPPDMSARVCQQVNRLPRTARLFTLPWLPGCYRGYVFCLIHILPLVIINGWTWQNAPRGRFNATLPLTVGMYALFYAGLATLISAIFHARNPFVRSTMVRATFLTIIAFMAVVPHFVVTLLEEWQNTRIEFGLQFLTSPYATISESMNAGRLGSSARFVTVLSALALASLTLLVVNFSGIANSILRTVQPLQLQIKDIPTDDVEIPESVEPAGAMESASEASSS